MKAFTVIVMLCVMVASIVVSATLVSGEPLVGVSKRATGLSMTLV